MELRTASPDDAAAIGHAAGSLHPDTCGARRASGVAGSRENEQVSEVDVPTVSLRLRAAGLSEQRIAEHLSARRIELDGEVVTDPDRPAPASTRIVLAGS